jgi:hypothetical protein
MYTEQTVPRAVMVGTDEEVRQVVGEEGEVEGEI